MQGDQSKGRQDTRINRNQQTEGASPPQPTLLSRVVPVQVTAPAWFLICEMGAASPARPPPAVWMTLRPVFCAGRCECVCGSGHEGIALASRTNPQVSTVLSVAVCKVHRKAILMALRTVFASGPHGTAYRLISSSVHCTGEKNGEGCAQSPRTCKQQNRGGYAPKVPT